MAEKSGPSTAPPLNVVEMGEERWRRFDDSVNAVSFGFVATAILISMFLVMAIFERLLRSSSAAAAVRVLRRRSEAADLEARRLRGLSGKLDQPPPKISDYELGVSVLMPGYDTPTFIAYPSPAPCQPERMPWPPHQIPMNGPTSNSS